MLLEKYLKEDFHFTAYSTISYVRKGPKVPKKEDDILFHGARVLKLPEYDAVWNGDTTTTSEENIVAGSSSTSSTPKANGQPGKRRKSNSAVKEGSAKRTKSKASGPASVASPNNRHSSTSSSVTTPKRPNVSKRSSNTTVSSKVVSTSKQATKIAAANESVAVKTSLPVQKTEVKSTRVETPSVNHATDDVIYIPVDQNVIEILD